jgi:predicted aspartyl protease
MIPSTRKLALSFGALLALLLHQTTAFTGQRPRRTNLVSTKYDDRHFFKTVRSATSRRTVLGEGSGFVLSSLLPDSKQQAAKTAIQHEYQEDLLADLPMVRLRLPKAALGREYVVLQLTIQGKGPFDFMVDTGLTTEMITPHLVRSLGMGLGDDKVRGLSAGGNTMTSLVPLEGVSLCCGKPTDNDRTELPLPSLTAVVTDFPQEHIDPSHDPVEGMLGMEALSLFDLDLDFPAGRIRLWAPGTAGKQAAVQKGLVEIPAVVINESGLYGIRVSAPGIKQPVLGLIDCGSTFSALNWAAAGYLGLPPKGDAKAYANAPAITAIGIDGKPFLMPTRATQLTFAGDAQKDSSTGALSFEGPPSHWKPWDPVQLAIGDLPVFRELLGDGKRPYEGPACLVGLDILAQRRVILETGETRQRRLWVG